MRTLRYFLAAGWIGYLGIALLCFLFPKSTGFIVGPIPGLFVLMPICLLIATAIYIVIYVYRSGMKRCGP
jgi:hypothetical protein